MFLLNLLVAASGTVAGYQERPNIIVFLVDDMGLMDTSVPFLTDGSGNRVRHSLNNWYHTPNMEDGRTRDLLFYFLCAKCEFPFQSLIVDGAKRNKTSHYELD